MDSDAVCTTTSDDRAPAPGADAASWEPFPQIDLRQLLRLTDDTGIFQHAMFATPDANHGYCIDDNARALIAALLHAKLRNDDERVVPLQRYLAFLAYAFNEQRQAFRNFMGYDRKWLEEEGSQDSQGRAIWALGLTVAMAPNQMVRELAHSLMEKGMPVIERLEYLRSWSFSLLGLDAFLKYEPAHEVALRLRDQCAQRLFKVYQAHATDDWPWWEDIVTYDNAKLSQALLLSGQAMRREDMVEAALRSLRWLLKVQTADAPDRHLSIIGNQGWLVRGSKKTQFDQQPLEAYAMVHACLTAAKVTGLEEWADHAWRCFEWFGGKNDLAVPVYHAETGGCQDGLQADGANKNQGAESSLAYLLSVLELHLYRDSQLGRIQVALPATIGYAVVGASGFASFCMEQYRQLEGIEPIGVWSRTSEHAQKLAERFDLQTYDNLGQLLDDPRVQLVHVASTPARHGEHAMAALAKGKHVLCEKPIAINLGDAQQMVQVAAQRDLQLAVNFVMRFGPLAKAVKHLIASGLLGTPLRGMLVNCAGDSGLAPDHWFWDEKESGGIFIEHGVHFFDLMRWWLGEAHVINALRLRRPNMEPNATGQEDNQQTPSDSTGSIVDQVAADLRYGQQTTVNFYHGFHQSPHLDRQSIELIFERGQLAIEGWIASKIDIRAVLSEAHIEKLQAIFPDAQVRTVGKFENEQRQIRRRDRKETVDRQIEMSWRSGNDKQTIYAQAASALMEDMLCGIRDRRHTLCVRGEDGQAALELALEAQRIAKGVTP